MLLGAPDDILSVILIIMFMQAKLQFKENKVFTGGNTG